MLCPSKHECVIFFQAVILIVYTKKTSCGLLGHLKTKTAEIGGRHTSRIFWSQAETEINALDWSLRKQQPGLRRFKKKLLN